MSQSTDELKERLLKHCRYQFKEHGKFTGWGDFNLDGLVSEVNDYTDKKVREARIDELIKLARTGETSDRVRWIIDDRIDELTKAKDKE